MNEIELPEADQSLIEQMRRDFLAGLLRRKEQKIVNAIGAYLGKESMAAEELMALKPRLRCAITTHDNAEHYYIDNHHLITFQEPTFTMEGNVMTAHQAYGPVATSEGRVD